MIKVFDKEEFVEEVFEMEAEYLERCLDWKIFVRI